MEKRYLKVSRDKPDNASAPRINLAGDWLTELGFYPDAEVTIFCESNKIIIKPKKLPIVPPSRQTIEELYHNNSNIWEFYEEHHKDYQDWQSLFLSESESFMASLPEHQRELFINLLDTLCGSSSVLYDCTYVSGFEMGMRLAIEALYHIT